MSNRCSALHRTLKKPWRNFASTVSNIAESPATTSSGSLRSVCGHFRFRVHCPKNRIRSCLPKPGGTISGMRSWRTWNGCTRTTRKRSGPISKLYVIRRNSTLMSACSRGGMCSISRWYEYQYFQPLLFRWSALGFLTWTVSGRGGRQWALPTFLLLKLLRDIPRSGKFRPA